jgi:hypothetical protein
MKVEAFFPYHIKPNERCDVRSSRRFQTLILGQEGDDPLGGSGLLTVVDVLDAR